MEFFLSFFLLLVNLQVYVNGISLTQYSFHEYCGRTIGANDVAGFLTFQSNYVHDGSFIRHECDIIISPKQLGTSNRVLFYFTVFDIGLQCRDNNLTIYNGRNSNIMIAGLEGSLCGHNKSLENDLNVFTSTENEIHLLYRWADNGGRYTGSFNLTFVSFFYGPCPDSEGIFGCSRNRCISSDLSCEDGINYCGNTQDIDDSQCELHDLLESVVNTVVNTIKDVGIFLAVVVGVFVAKVYVFDRCKRRYGSVKNMPVIRWFFNDSRNTQSSDRHRSSSVVLGERSVDADQISLALSDGNDNMTDTTPTSSLDPPSYDTFTNSTTDQPTENTRTNSVDPPTYDTFISDVNRYSIPDIDESYQQIDPSAPPMAPPIPSPVAPPPSYEDVMSNHENYVRK